MSILFILLAYVIVGGTVAVFSIVFDVPKWHGLFWLVLIGGTIIPVVPYWGHFLYEKFTGKT